MQKLIFIIAIISSLWIDSKGQPIKIPDRSLIDPNTITASILAGNIEVVQYLIASSISANEICYGRSALIWAVVATYSMTIPEVIRLVDYLIIGGANIWYKDIDGLTAMDWAYRVGRGELAERMKSFKPLKNYTIQDCIEERLLIPISESKIGLFSTEGYSEWNYECKSECLVQMDPKNGKMPVKYFVQEYFRKMNQFELNRINRDVVKIVISNKSPGVERIKKEIMEVLKEKRFQGFIIVESSDPFSTKN
jgi:hypothetical protein